MLKGNTTQRMHALTLSDGAVCRSKTGRERCHMIGKNQSYIREINRKAILETLIAEDCSATMLARKLSLSNASLSTILGGLLRDGYICRTAGEKRSGYGRPPVYYTFNAGCGALLSVVLANYYATIVVSDMRMNILARESMRAAKYDLSMLVDLVSKAKELLAAPRCAAVPLVGVNFSVPGRVNSGTGELQLSPQFDESIFGEGNGIVRLFEKQFGVPVRISNDIDSAARGEMNVGALKGVQNGVLAYVDEGIGGAIVLGGGLYCGEQGFAGEIGLMRADFRGCSDVLDEFVSLRVLKKYFSEHAGEKLHTADIVRLYRGDEAARSYINETAHCLGKKIRDIVELLDISTIVLSGRVVQFGEEYLNAVNAEVAASLNGAKVVASSLGEDATVYGTASEGVRAFLASVS